MQTILSLMLFVALFVPSLAQTDAHPVRLIVAVPPGQPMTDDDIRTSMQIATDALAFWTRHDPAHPVYVLDSVQVLDVPQPSDDDALWRAPIVAMPQDMPTVWVYVNHDPFYLFPGYQRNVSGMAILNSALVVLEQHRFRWSSAAILAHELGHVLYHLNDLYDDGPCDPYDLMCAPETAYHADWLGCQSLAAIGGGCKTQYLPIVGHEPDSPCLRLYHPNAARRSVSPCVASTRRPATTRGTGGSIPQ